VVQGRRGKGNEQFDSKWEDELADVTVKGEKMVVAVKNPVK
jgi:hypothetical protein